MDIERATPRAFFPGMADGDTVEAGDRVGPWEICREVGRGGSSVVYEARHVDLDLRVALKRLLAGNAAAPGERERFFREAHTLAQVRHPHLVAVRDAGADARGPWLLMDLLQGETLAQRLRSPRGMDPYETLGVGLAVLSVLVRLHADGVLHGDIKPENIHLGARSLMSGVRLLDLSAMRRIATGAPGFVTGHEPGHGTPGYMAPELAAGGRVDGRADLYALSVVLRACFVTPLPRTFAPLRPLLVAGRARSPARRPRSALAMGDALATFARHDDRERWIALTADARARDQHLAELYAARVL